MVIGDLADALIRNDGEICGLECVRRAGYLSREVLVHGKIVYNGGRSTHQLFVGECEELRIHR